MEGGELKGDGGGGSENETGDGRTEIERERENEPESQRQREREREREICPSLAFQDHQLIIHLSKIKFSNSAGYNAR